MRQITLALKGQPMAKQSVRKGKNRKTGKDIYYQPESKKKRIESYTLQIKSQLPKDFVMFTEIVHVEFLQIMLYWRFILELNH